MKIENIMEKEVIDCINQNIDKIDCCGCEQCKSDIAAYVLNHITPKYVATEAGALYSKANHMGQAAEIEIMVEVARAAEVVKMHPRH